MESDRVLGAEIPWSCEYPTPVTIRALKVLLSGYTVISVEGIICSPIQSSADLSLHLKQMQVYFFQGCDAIFISDDFIGENSYV